MQSPFRTAGHRHSLPVVAVAVLALMVLASACGKRGDRSAHTGLSDAKPADGGQDLRADPCSLAAPEAVAVTFGVPVAELEQASLGSMCAYEWRGLERRLNVNVLVERVAADDEDAMRYFDRSAAATVPATRADGSARFCDVSGVGDQARFDAVTGVLSVRHGPLVFTVEAYHGEHVSTAGHDLASMVAANRAWRARTMGERQRDAVALARAMLE